MRIQGVLTLLRRSFQQKLVNGTPIWVFEWVLNSPFFGFRISVPLEGRIRIKILMFQVTLEFTILQFIMIYYGLLYYC